MTSSRRRAVLCAVVVAAVTVIAFLPALGANFVSWDDERNIVTNPHYRGLGLEQLRWMWTTTLLGHYVPLSWMTLGADYAIWGMRPVGYHLTNLLFHAANAVLVFVLARGIFVRAFEKQVLRYAQDDKKQVLRYAQDDKKVDRTIDFAAAIAALLFAVHPLRVESVAWVTERRDVVSLFFCLLTVIAYLRATAGERWSRGWYAASLLLFVCALLSKGNSVTVPAVLLILNFYPLRRVGPGNWTSPSARRAYRELVPFGIPAAGFVALSIVALHPPGQLGLGGKLAVSAYSLVFYLAKTLLPTKLAALYSMPVTVDPLATRFLLPYAGVVCFAIAIAMTFRSRPGIAAALLAFAAVTLPMLGIVQNGPQIAADRYTYHAASALALLGGAAWISARRRFGFAPLAAIAIAVIATLSALTWRQTGFWKDSEHLWARVLSIEPDSPLGNSAWANLLFKQNRVDEAIEYSMRSIRAAPGFAEGHNDLGVGYARKGAFDQAIAQYQNSLALKPEFDEAENNWGVVLAGQGQLDSAVAHYRRALSFNADNPDAEVNWGNVLVRAGRTDEAIEHYRRALWIRPDHADAHHNWGVALARDGKLAEAVTHFQSALAIDPAHAEAREYLARATQLLRERSP